MPIEVDIHAEVRAPIHGLVEQLKIFRRRAHAPCGRVDRNAYDHGTIFLQSNKKASVPSPLLFELVGIRNGHTSKQNCIPVSVDKPVSQHTNEGEFFCVRIVDRPVDVRGICPIVIIRFLLQDAYDSGYETIWVMEDDIQVIRNPHMLSDLIDKLDALVGKNWDILFTDQDTKNSKGEYVICLSYAARPNFTPQHPERFAEREQISEDFRKIGARYGAYSMIVRRSGIEKILNFIKRYQVFLPYDMDFYLPDDISIYTVVDDVVSTQPQAPTDNAFPGYQQKTKEELQKLNRELLQPL